MQKIKDKSKKIKVRHSQTTFEIFIFNHLSFVFIEV